MKFPLKSCYLKGPTDVIVGVSATPRRKATERNLKSSQRLLLIGILVYSICSGECHKNLSENLISMVDSSEKVSMFGESNHKTDAIPEIYFALPNASINSNKSFASFFDTRTSPKNLDLSRRNVKEIYESRLIKGRKDGSRWNQQFKENWQLNQKFNLENKETSSKKDPTLEVGNVEIAEKGSHYLDVRIFYKNSSLIMTEGPEIALPPGFSDKKVPEGCQCWQTVDDSFLLEKECICRGDEVAVVPTNLAQDVQRLTFSNVPISSIKNADLSNYEETLQEITFANAPNLWEIEKETFANLSRLKSLAFHHIPNLKELPDSIFAISLPNLKIMRISNTGLKTLPTLNQLSTNNILHLLDFEFNSIRGLKTGQITIRVEQMLLSNNEIEYIDKMAFKGSEIGTLRLRGNRKLKYLHSEAFKKITSLRILDLSETSIEVLPVEGLDELEELYLQDVMSLKVFPSVFAFRKLSKAFLTYHYHCCAFYFPQVHNPEAYKKQEEIIKFFQKKHCSNLAAERTITAYLDKNVSNDFEGHWGKPSSPLKSENESEIQEDSVKMVNPLQSKGIPYQDNINSESHSRISDKGYDDNSQNILDIGFKNSGHKSFSLEKHGNFNYTITPDLENARTFPIYVFNNSFGNSYSGSEKSPKEFLDVHSVEGFFDLSSGEKFPSTSFDEKKISVEREAKEVSTKERLIWTAMEEVKNRKSMESGRENESFQQFGRFHQETARLSENHLTAFCGKVSLNLKRKVICEPQPDAFNPCEDILGGFQGVRAAVWVVVVTAVVGNFSVMVVLLSARFKMTVSKLLMCNLAFADLCMGFYSMIIAAMDIHTKGKYFNFAIDWQNGIGCKLGGFLTVFSSELSVMTLTVITLERWYAITYAIHLTKRLRLRAAKKIMICAWLFSFLMASLPLLGVSSYSKTSICLPMENKNVIDLIYLLILLSTNGLAFLLISVCYGSMYVSISKNNMATSSSDMTVAKRMGLLVATDFACWAPIAFFGLTAVAGYPLIGVTHAKFLLVFFYPLNSCANPYLYAILTKQYRKDFFILLARYGFCAKRAAKYKGACSSLTNPHMQGAVGGSNIHKDFNRRTSTLTQISTLGEYCSRRKEHSLENLDKTLITIPIQSISSAQAQALPTTDDVTQQGCLKRVNMKKVLILEPQKDSIDPGDESTIRSSASTDSFFNIKSFCSSGSPHPIKNWQTRMKFSQQNEFILKQLSFSNVLNLKNDVTKTKSSFSEEDIGLFPAVIQSPPSPSTVTSPLSLFDEEGVL